MKEKLEKKDFFWKVIAVVALVAFGIQGGITYYALTNDSKNSNENKIMEEPEDIHLMPRNLNAVQYQNPQQNRVQHNNTKSTNQLSPQAIPKLNVNVNTLPGVKRSKQLQTQQQQSPQRHLKPGGMNININNSPFGTDIREEMARMEALMNQMMSRSGMGMNMPSMGNSMNMSIPSRGTSITMSGGGSPAITVDNDNNYVVTLKMPGLDKSEIKARVNGNMLTVSGVQRKETSSNSQGGNSYISSYSSFQNSFSLPGPAKSTGLKLDYKDDTLTVKVPQA